MKHKHKLYPLLSVEDAMKKVLSVFSILENERVHVLDALDRILAEDIYAKGNIPPMQIQLWMAMLLWLGIPLVHARKDRLT